jgi:formylglycine-generating enzyme required for sulfatase activity
MIVSRLLHVLLVVAAYHSIAGCYSSEPASESTEDIDALIAEAGLTSLNDYVRFGSKETADKYRLGDQFDRLELKKTIDARKASLRTKKFRMEGLALTVAARDDMETKGLWAELPLQMRILGVPSFHDNAKNFRGSLRGLHPSEALNGSSFGFFTKDKTIQTCTPQEAHVVLQRDGILYIGELANTILILRIRDSVESMKDIFRNSGDYTVSLEFADLQVQHAGTWGYFRQSALIENDWDCQRLRQLNNVGLDGPAAPNYFVTSRLLLDGETKLPELLTSQLTSLRILHKSGKVIGEYGDGKALALTPAEEKKAPKETQPAVTPPVVLDTPRMTNSIGVNLRLLPAGTFMMGDAGGEPNNKPHRVTLTKPFYMGVHEVTNAQWKQVMGSVPSNWKDDDHPVEMVSWMDAVEFCGKLSALPAERKAGRAYRLPTEAEWEYACRAGTTTKYSFGDDEKLLGDYGWFPGNSGRRTHPVGLKKPNAWGLYDMHGNVWEWCSDWSGDYPDGEVTNPHGPSLGSYRANRGGGWSFNAGICRSALRDGGFPSYRFDDLGFRLALSPSGAETPEAGK